jgi:hypothetical protein
LTLEEIEDAQDLRSVIAAGLAATPVDEESLRQAVWTYVGAERDVGARPGRVIVTLTELVEAAPMAPRTVRDERMRRVILWCASKRTSDVSVAREWEEGALPLPATRRWQAADRVQPMSLFLLPSPSFDSLRLHSPQPLCKCTPALLHGQFR